jgi:GTPase Era involved in 16S rRNA processing
MAYFQEVVQRTTEQNKPLIVFLNKIDLFEEKLKVKPLKEVYDDYEGKKSHHKQELKRSLNSKASFLNCLNVGR